VVDTVGAGHILGQSPGRLGPQCRWQRREANLDGSHAGRGHQLFQGGLPAPHLTRNPSASVNRQGLIRQALFLSLPRGITAVVTEAHRLPAGQGLRRSTVLWASWTLCWIFVNLWPWESPRRGVVWCEAVNRRKHPTVAFLFDRFVAEAQLISIRAQGAGGQTSTKFPAPSICDLIFRAFTAGHHESARWKR